MKKVLSVVLIFAVVLAALLGVSALWERVRPAPPEPAEEPARETNTAAGEPDPAGATVIRLAQDGTSVTGVGAEVRDNRVTIAYPGTYRVEGTLESGQLVVDLGDFSGEVYLLLNGASVTCGDGPALHVKQADLAAVYLAAGTENALCDGAAYVVEEGPESRTGAGIYSADDLYIYGDGALTVTGRSADGIRSKDALTVAGGTLRVYAADDGLQASDLLEIRGGDITVACYGDGLSTTQGGITVYDGRLSVTSAGDGVAAVTDLAVLGGSISVTAYGGAENYETVAVNELSAKGLKAARIEISGGDIALDTADDGIHADGDIALTGGTFVIASGDDGVHSGGTLEVRGVRVDVTESYEGLEGEAVVLTDAVVAVSAENNGIDTGEGGLAGSGTALTVAAPRAISSDGALDLVGCSVDHSADGTDSLFSFREARLVGCTVLATAGTGRSEVLLEKGELPGSLFVGFGEAVPAGTPITLTDPNGETVLSFVREADTQALLLVNGGLLDGQTYTVAAGEQSAELSYDASSGAVNEPEPVVAAPQGGFPGFPGFPGGGPRR